MKYLLVSVVVFISGLNLCRGDDIPQGAVNYFVNKYDHKDPDVLQIVSIDFRGDKSPQFLMTFAKGDWRGPEAVWSMIELKNNQWTEPKTFDVDGKINDFSALQFDPSAASFVYLPSYNRSGLLAHWKEMWTFTYLNGDTLQTEYFWTASEAGLTNDVLNKMMDDHKIVVKQQSVR